MSLLHPAAQHGAFSPPPRGSDRGPAKRVAARAVAIALAGVAAFVGIGAGCNRGAPLPTAAQPLALLTLPTLGGERFDPGGLAGRVVVVNFWSPG
jgi:hypothetical protein